MLKRVFLVLLCGIFISGVTGCEKEDDLSDESSESFLLGHTLDDGRHISFTFDILYGDGYLSEALVNDQIKVDDFIDKLDFETLANDGGSKLYKYNKSKKIFGDKDFYVIVCNSYAGIKDIFVAKNVDSLSDKCILKINDLDGVSMTIKNDTLTKEGATLVIKDVSSRNNMYGEEYRIDKKINGEWIELDVIVTGNYGFTSIGYTVGEDNKLELEVNWKWLYGELQNGEYRIVKSTSEPGEGTLHYITAEFEIE